LLLLLLLEVGTTTWKSCRLGLHEPRSSWESRLLGLLEPLWTLSREPRLLYHHPTAAIGDELRLLLLKRRVLLLLKLGSLLLELWILLELGVSS
jgi:hypothetical protein